ncbi:MAG: PDZ domain-containing protein [Polyangiaceae bacterium]
MGFDDYNNGQMGRGGLQVGDILLAVDGRPIRERDDVVKAVHEHRDRGPISVSYQRRGAFPVVARISPVFVAATPGG